MRLKMFAVFDNKADLYLTPFFMPANGQAVRAFSDLANDVATIVGRHPDDYKLVFVGELDDATAEFYPAGLVSLGFGSDFVKKSNIVPLGGVSHG
ncbi:MAG: nonstructural protein [Microvirus sp.]|nr:MAG: nonstructural protein [Microvirus sp.]